MEANENQSGEYSWGPKLLTAVLVGTLIFFWWLLIYSHGVVAHH